MTPQIDALVFDVINNLLPSPALEDGGVVWGNHCTIIAPDGSLKIAGRYAAVPVSWPIPSHDPTGQAFTAHPDFDQANQPRSMDRQIERDKVVRQSQKIEPTIIVSNSPLASTAFPVARKANRNLIAGNGRWMMLLLARELNPEGYRAVLSKARADAKMYGIEPGFMGRDYMIIRIVDCTEEEGHAMAAPFNRRESQSESLIQLARQLGEAQAGPLGDLVVRYEADTLAKMLDMTEANCDAIAIVRAGLGDRDAETFIDRTHGGQYWLNDLGRALISKAIALQVAGSKEMAAYLEAADPAIVQRIVMAAKPIAQLNHIIANSKHIYADSCRLESSIRIAIECVAMARRMKAATPEAIVQQGDVASAELIGFLDDCPLTRAIVGALLDVRPSRLRHVLEHYVAACEVFLNPEGQMFGGGVTPGIAAWQAQRAGAMYRGRAVDNHRFLEEYEESVA